ncbi:MAG: hypothetical protein KF762_12605 [Acidobacteria bacterium]|nr:hypothetical protein [Acidobacteriota bacterium]
MTDHSPLRLRDRLIDDLFRYLETRGDVVMGSASSADVAALESLTLPLELKRVLQWNWPVQLGRVGPYSLYGVTDLLSDEDLTLLMDVGMLPIGYAINGDPLVIKFSDSQYEVGLISHDEYWEDRSAGPENCYVTVTSSLDELLWRAAESKFLPVDFYAASELAEMRAEFDYTSPS